MPRLCYGRAMVTRAGTQAGWSIAIHGGAGTMDRATMSADEQDAYRAALGVALDAGTAVLAAGGSALDAVEAAVMVLEDDPRFNAGRGAVFSYTGVNELDAAIMDGRERAAGAVTGVTHVKNPVKLARAVMEDSAARVPRPRRRRGIRPRARDRDRRSRLVRDARALAAIAGAQGEEPRLVRRRPQVRHGRRGGASTGRAMSPRRPRPAG